MIGLDRVMVGLTHAQEPFLHSMLDKPDCSSVHVRHFQ